MADIPGIAIPLGFNMRPCGPADGLSPEARKRVMDKIAAVEHARRIALAASMTYVVGRAQILRGTDG